MARIAGVDLPRNKHVDIALTYIYGIGNSRSKRLLGVAKVEPMKKVQDLNEDEVNRIRQAIEAEGDVEGDLRKDISMHIKRLIDAEDPVAILSDDTIVERLREAGIEIARRTVAKYREAMRIPSSVQRRRDKQSALGQGMRSRDTEPA